MIDLINRFSICSVVLLTGSVFLSACGGSGTDSVPVAGIEIGAARNADSVSYSVQLSGAQVLPAVDTRETGLAEFYLDEITGQLFGTVSTSIQTSSEVHLHEGSVNEVGGLIVSLVPAVAGSGNSVFNVPANFILTQQQQELYVAGDVYVDVHAGEIQLRGQLSTLQFAPAIGAELSDLQTKLFTPVCSGCHTGTGNSLPAIMDFTSVDATYNSLVGVFSIGEPEMLRVEAGDADSSLLIKKIEGLQTVGARMPFRGARLDAETIAAVRQWIDAGAGK